MSNHKEAKAIYLLVSMRIGLIKRLQAITELHEWVMDTAKAPGVPALINGVKLDIDLGHVCAAMQNEKARVRDLIEQTDEQLEEQLNG